jgi:hypothetical protein
MIKLISQLRACSDERRAWGLTSNATLVLLSSDASGSPWYVRIFAPSSGGYHIEYPVPADLAPWPHAYVHGDAETVREAIDMVLTSMDRSGGWTAAGSGSRAGARATVGVANS